jgi:hypothetical protein
VINHQLFNGYKGANEWGRSNEFLAGTTIQKLVYFILLRKQNYARCTKTCGFASGTPLLPNIEYKGVH